MTLRPLLASLCLVSVCASAAVWSTGTYTVGTGAATDYVPARPNLLADLTPSASTTSSAGVENSGGLEVLTDGVIGGGTVNDKASRFTIGNNDVLEYTLGDGQTPHLVTEVRVFSTWNDAGRDTISIASVETLSTNGTWTTISPGAITHDDGSFRACVVLADAQGAPLATDATALRIHFGTQENGYVGYSEIEAIGSDLSIPSLGIADWSVSAFSASTMFSVYSVGFDGATSCDVTVSCGSTDSDLQTCTWTGLSVGNTTFPVAFEELVPGTSYTCVFSVTNDQGVSHSVSRPFSTPAEPAKGLCPGLLQGRLPGVYNDFSADPSTAIDQRRELGAVMGLAPYSSTGVYTSEIDGVGTAWSEHVTFVYTGDIYLEANTVYTFGMHQDDSSYLKIDGTVLIDTGATYCAARSATYVVATTGWYPIDVRVGNATVGAGSRNTGSYGNTGVGYSTDGGTTWNYLKDTGDGSFLRTPGDGRTDDLTVVSAALDGNALVATLDVDTEFPVDLHAWYGTTYGGADPTTWDHDVFLVSKQETTEQTVPVRVEFPAGTRYVRFAALHENITITADTVVLADLDSVPAALQLQLRAPVAMTPVGVTLPVSLVSPGAGATDADLFLDFGTNSADLADSRLLADNVTGLSTNYVLDGLCPGLTYFVRARAVNSLSATASTETISFTLPTETSPAYLPGLLQGQLSGAFNTGPASSATGWRRELGALMGLSLANNYAVPFISDVDGASTFWGDNITFVYTGYIHLEGGLTYAFGGNVDDDSTVAIDGVQVYRSTGNKFGSGTIAIENTGWHAIEVRVGNGTGNAGGNTGWIGVGYNASGNADAAASGWHPLKDSGAGTLLRCADPSASPRVTVLSAETDGNALIATVEIDIATPIQLYAVYGPDYGGADPTAWASSAWVASKLLSGASETVSFRLPIAANTRFVRFFAADSLDDPTRNMSGTVLVEQIPAAADEARVALRSTSVPGLFDAHFSVDFLQTGSAGNATLTLEYGPADGDFPVSVPVAADASLGNYAAVLTNLQSRTTYHARARAVATGSDVVSDTVTFSTQIEPEYADSIAGLIQGRIAAANDAVTTMAGATNLRRELGPVMGHIRNGSYTSELDGVATAWAGNTTFLYEGYIYLEAGNSYAFGANIDDMSMTVINGSTVEYTAANTFAAGLYTANTTGWYPVSLRVGNGGGDAGKNSGGVNNLGFAYNAVGDVTSGSENWTLLKDPGDGSLFRVSLTPGDPLITVVSARKEGDTLVADLRIAIGEAANIRAWTGATYGGIDDNAWDDIADITQLSDGATVTLPVRLAVDEGTKFIRFFAERPSDSHRWTADTLIFDSLESVGSDPIIVLESAAPGAALGSGIVSVAVQSLGAGASDCDVELFYGLSADAMNDSLVLTNGLDTVGSIIGTISSLLPGRRYFVQALATNNLNGSALSEILSLTVAALPEETVAVSSDAVSLPGLIQGRFNGVFNEFAADPSTAADQRRELGAVMGLAPYGNTGVYTSEIDGVRTAWSEHVTFVYTGVIHLTFGTTYTFGMHQDDSSYLKIDGNVLIDTGATYCEARSATYTPAYTGWFPIDVRVGNATAGAGNRNYGNYGNTGVGYSTDGGTTWNYLKDAGDGSFLRTGLTVRSITVTNDAVANGSYSATLQLSTLSDESLVWPLYACYGSTYGGDDTNGWEHVELLGNIPASTDTLAFGPLAGAVTTVRFVRFVFDGGEYGLDWSETQTLHDPATPELSPDVIVSGLEEGDHTVLTGELLSTGGGTCVLYAEVATSADFTDPVAWPGVPSSVNAPSTCVFDLSTNDTASAAYLVPGRTYYARIVARGPTGLLDTTPIVSFASLAGTSIGAVTTSVAQRSITISTTLDLGANDTTLWLYTGTSADALAPAADVPPVVLSSDDNGAVSLTTKASSYAPLYYAIVVSNDCSTATWTSWSAGADTGIAVPSVTPVDNSSYYWKGTVHEGDWSDGANWDVEPYDELLTFPNSSVAKVYFTRCSDSETPYRVFLDGTYTVQNVTLGAPDAGTDLTLWGTNAATCRLNTGDFTTVARQTLVLDDVYLRLTGWFTTSDNGFLAVRNGSYVDCTSEIWFTNHGGTAEISGRSTVHTNGKLWLGGRNGLVIIDDADVTVNNLINFSFNGGQDHVLEFRGARPRLICAKDSSVTTTDNPAGGSPTVRFVVPRDGYTEAPIQTTGGNVFLGAYANQRNDQVMRIVVSADSPYFKSGHALRGQKLIEYAGGINADYIDVSAQPLASSTTMRYTFGANQAAAPSEDGEKPTILWADLVAHGATVLVIQ